MTAAPPPPGVPGAARDPGTAAGESAVGRERIAAVVAQRQGSGYLLTPRLVLTAAHVVAGAAPVRVVVPGGVGEVPCRVVWDGSAEHCDAALLAPLDPLVPHGTSAGWAPVRWGQTGDLRPRPGCHAIGYPYAQHGGTGRLESEQLIGTLKPGSSLVRGGYVVSLEGTPPQPLGDGGSPWAGMSGAALFDGELLMGVIVTDPEGWQHGRLTAVPATAIHIAAGFHDTYRAHTGAPPELETIGRRRSRRTGFEVDYRSYIQRNHGELRIFGLDFSRSDRAQWPLDTAYLSLELSGRGEDDHLGADRSGADSSGAPYERSGGRQRVEGALAGRTRVLLRGLAGSGKTTLVQWLAVTAARDAFGHQLGHLDDCVPFVLPLRTLIRSGELPDPAGFLKATGTPLTPPSGWAEQLMRSGRALLLIDGVDEVPEHARGRTQRWLDRLLAAYPDCNYVVTTRPTAVADGWLEHQGFTELDLLPMNRQDVDAFVRRWHLAAYGEDGEDGEDGGSPDPGAAEERDRYTARLLDTLRSKRDLSRLATNPLMCAMICALHRDRRTHLPESRMDLYSAALTMLLVRRDKERDVDAPEGWDIPEDAQRQLLQEFAYWLIRNGQAEATQDTAVKLIARLLPAMSGVAPPEQAGDVFRHLVRRSGVLREPNPQTVDFVHRTFQDYLGAKAAVEAQDIALVAEHADDPQWEDVVRMAVGHGRPDERAELLRRIVERGDSAEREEVRTRLHLLAAAGLEHATRLAPEVRQEVQQRAARLVPPRTMVDAERLATAGPVVLDLLPAPERLADETQLAATVCTAARIGGEHALHVLRRFRDHPAGPVRQQLADAWGTFDAERYADTFLARIDLTDVTVLVSSEAQLAVLDRIGRVGMLDISGSFPEEALLPGLRTARPHRLRLQGNDSFHDLRFLDVCAPELEELVLSDCGGLIDYGRLPALGIARLTLDAMPAGPDLGPLAEAETLTWVSISSRTAYGGLAELPLPPGLRELCLGGQVLRVPSLAGVGRRPALEVLEIDPGRSAFLDASELAHLVALPALRRLSLPLTAITGPEWAELPVLAQVTELQLEAGADRAVDFTGLREVFPSLTGLRVQLHHGQSFLALDVTALRGIDGQVEVELLTSGNYRLVGEKTVEPQDRLIVRHLSTYDADRRPWRSLRSLFRR